jgi:hypothetical protein
MTTYRVIWSIDLEADSPRDAAMQAQAIQWCPDSTANVFDVIPSDADQEVIDLDAPEGDCVQGPLGDC